VADGLRYKDIAVEVHRSANYIKSAGFLLCIKLGADNITQAVAMALRRGIIE
jgi:DNA-binding NarL/FixJ family response regulator